MTDVPAPNQCEHDRIYRECYTGEMTGIDECPYRENERLREENRALRDPVAVDTAEFEVYVSVSVDGTGNWVRAKRLKRPDVLAQLEDGTIGVWPVGRVRTAETSAPLLIPEDPDSPATK